MHQCCSLCSRLHANDSEPLAIMTCFRSTISIMIQKENYLMGDAPRYIEIIPDYFETTDSPQHISCQDSSPSSTSLFQTNSFTPYWKKSRTASFMLRLFSLKGLRANGDEKVELTAVELECLRSELKDVEEREAHLKAQLEHLDEILRWSRLSGYLYMRTRWDELPGELPPIDDCDVDDWIPRFIVLQGPCLFFYLSSTDLSPLDSTLLSDIIELDQLPSIVKEKEEVWHCFYIVTRYGLRIECSSVSRIQVDSWLTALRAYCKFEPAKTDSVGENCDGVSQKCV